MKKLFVLLTLLGALAVTSLPVLVVAPALSGCATVGGTNTSNAAYNSLAAVQAVTEAGVDGYLDLVVQKKVGTNATPTVLGAYNTYQLAYRAALDVAQSNTNAPAPANVLSLSQNVLSTISTAKGGK